MRHLKIATAVYIVFAILIAHIALARPAVLFFQTVVEQTTAPDLDKSNYTVEVWSSKRCVPCRTYTLTEIPVLKRLGYAVVIRDVDKEGWPEGVKQIPTIRLHYKGQLLTEQRYWRALDIDQYVKQRASLKEQFVVKL